MMQKPLETSSLTPEARSPAPPPLAASGEAPGVDGRGRSRAVGLGVVTEVTLKPSPVRPGRRGGPTGDRRPSPDGDGHGPWGWDEGRTDGPGPEIDTVAVVALSRLTSTLAAGMDGKGPRRGSRRGEVTTRRGSRWGGATTRWGSRWGGATTRRDEETTGVRVRGRHMNPGPTRGRPFPFTVPLGPRSHLPLLSLRRVCPRRTWGGVDPP